MLFFNGITDGYEDYRRHKSDNLTNNRKVLILINDDDGRISFVEKKWKDINVYLIYNRLVILFFYRMVILFLQIY